MSDHTNAWSRVTCDMTDSEFCAWVRERCEMTLKNTAAGVYMQGLIDRLLKSEAENERLREALEPFAGIHLAGTALPDNFAFDVLTARAALGDTQ